MHNDYIERYIYAVSKRLPYKIRNDVGKELRGIISDMLEARCDGLPPTDQDIRIVLTELGSPTELAEKYNPDKQKYLIGPGYYQSYKLLLRIILPALAFGLAVAFIIIALLGGHDAPLPVAMWQWLGMLFSSVLGVFASFTIIFAIFERRGIPFDMAEDGLHNLPPLPNKEDRISKGQSLAGIILNILFCVVFLAAPQIIGWYVDGGSWAPVFHIPILRTRWLLLVLITILGLIREAIRLLDGSYTRRVTFASIITDVLTAPLFIMLFRDAQILNPIFLQGIRNIFTGNADFVYLLFDNFHTFFIGIFLFALALDIGTVVTRMLRTRHAEKCDQ